MKRLILLASLFVLLAPSLLAGLTYEFRSVSEGSGRGSEIHGTASAENGKLRLDVAKGDGLVFKDGSVALSNDGGRTWILIDPKQKTYYELDVERLVSSLTAMLRSSGGTLKMAITNQQVKVIDAGAGGLLEGYPTRRWVVSSRYDMSIAVFGMKSESHVETRSESWATDKLPAEAQSFVQLRGFRTGIPDVDRLIAAQSAGVKGFPLKQVVTSTSTAKNGSKTTTVTTVTISKVAGATIPATRFEVPAGYRKVEPSMLP